MYGRERDINEIPSHSRRLDSIGWLIQGTNVCGAANFDGERLLLATNSTEESELISDIKNYLTQVSIEAKNRYELGDSADITQEDWEDSISVLARTLRRKHQSSFERIGTFLGTFLML